MKLLLAAAVLFLAMGSAGCCCCCAAWFDTWKYEWDCGTPCGKSTYHESYTEPSVGGTSSKIQVTTAGS